MIVLYFLDLGEGWAPAVLNGQREADFIRAGQRLFCHNDRSYWIGGSTNVQPWNIFHISEHNTGNTGIMMLIFNSLKVHSHYVFFFCISVCNLRQTQRMGIHSLRLMQLSIDAMLQFGANTNAHAHANVDTTVNGP